MKWLAVLLLVLAASCDPGQPTYLDRVRALPADQAHPVYRQLLPLVEHPRDLTLDQLMISWKAFLADRTRPLREDTTFTFVYYDFSHALNQVSLEASFTTKPEPMQRVGQTSLFVKVYDIPKPGRAHYRYTDGTNVLPDPFFADFESGDDVWQPLVPPESTNPTMQWVTAASEPDLDGDVRILLPPSYRTDLGTAYPLVVVVGVEGSAWSRPLESLMREGKIRPVIVAAVKGASNLKSSLEEKLVPWLRSRYRASALPSDLVLIGWGSWAQPTQAVAAARPDFWNKSWTPLSEQARGDEAWNTLTPPFFRTQFTVVTP